MKADYTDLIDLFSYIIQYDNKVSQEEIDFIHQFIQNNYDEKDSKRIYDYFLASLKEKKSLNNIIPNLEKKYKDDYIKKVELSMSLYELIARDEILDEELELFETICRLFKMNLKEIDLIGSVLLTHEKYQYPDNALSVLKIGDNPDLHQLIYSEVNVKIFKIKGSKYISNINSSVDVFLDDQRLRANKIEPLINVKKIRFSRNEIDVKDIDYYFFLDRQDKSEIQTFVFDKGYLKKLDEVEGGDFNLLIYKNQIRCLINRKDLSICVNEVEAEEEIFLNLSDKILINGEYPLPLKEIILSKFHIYFPLKSTEKKKEAMMISNKNLLADFYIEDNEEEELNIQINIKVLTTGNQFYIQIEKIPYPVLLNDNLVEEKKTYEVADENSTLKIKRTQINFDINSGLIHTTYIRFQFFRVERLSYDFSDHKNAIDEISFEGKSGQLNCIMGPSGSGKSTLLKLLSGYLKPKSGKVKLDETDYYQNFDLLKNHIGYVPQDDLLKEHLTVFENLLYSAKIRLPNKNSDEIKKIVERVVKAIDLYEQRDLIVGTLNHPVLSGGQRKRLNIGLELISDPDLFFLDEPTSGLSSLDSKKIIQILDNLAKRGKIIFCVIHQPSAEIYKRFENLLLLDRGGKLAYYGNTHRAIDYFKRFLPEKQAFSQCPICGSVNPDLMIDVLEQEEEGVKSLNEQKAENLSLFKRLFKKHTIPKITKRRYDPDYWKLLFQTELQEGRLELESDSIELLSEKIQFRKLNFIDNLKNKARVLKNIFYRDMIESIRDRMNLVLSFAAPLFLGILLSYLLKGKKSPYFYSTNSEMPKFFFLSVIIFIFLGLMSSVSLIYKEKPLIRREKMIRLSSWQYLSSKSIQFILVSMIQVFFYTLISFSILEIPSKFPCSFQGVSIPPYMSFFLYFVLMGVATSFAAYQLGLFISTLVQSEFAAFNFIPLIIIPQILFGGMFIEYSSISKKLRVYSKSPVPEFCNLTLSRWAYEGLLSASEILNPVYRLENTKFLKYHDRDQTWEKLEGMKQMKNHVPLKIDIESWNKIKKLKTKKLAKIYQFDENENVYFIKKKSEHLKNKIAELELFSEYDRFKNNEYIHNMLLGSYFWHNKIRENESKVKQKAEFWGWVFNENEHPRHKKFFGNKTFYTIWYNLFMIFLHALVFFIFTLIRVRKI